MKTIGQDNRIIRIKYWLLKSRSSCNPVKKSYCSLLTAHRSPSVSCRSPFDCAQGRPLTLRLRSGQAAYRSPAFTLIELLIVIFVITILAGMLFPVIIKTRTWAREKQSAMEIQNIQLAIKAYHSVYGKWPNQTQSATDTCYVLDNSAVIEALTTNNPRSKVFLQVQQSSISTNPATMGSYLDPWGHAYVIAADESGDNQVTVASNTFILTNLNGVVTTNTLSFTDDVSVKVLSWGVLDSPATFD